VTAAQLAFGRRVLWRGLRAEIVDIRWNQHTVNVCVRVNGGHTHWAKVEELEVLACP